ncbi:aldehyde oxygenase (deformylating) [Leptolyngbya sp. 'hensonii']|uniref:aldehyde oxygenase (deformylating) n=1 Tax=Leptolyngbya sp. 'hensonii' TaxID=1922337 RepID=UPI00094F7F2D|nr:aldehyde oxygenase (deformylating) [Leptolyngbya sp. 'hensonii']OLP17705.1 aldehyde oxygenase (deformylating) [Leptolyngbya sp. 'hensonii']
MVQGQINAIDFFSDPYRDAYSRVNGIVLEGEQQAYENFVRLAELLPEHKAELSHLAEMEARHRKSFEACGRNLKVTPDLDFAQRFFADLHGIFQHAADAGQTATCLLVQALVIECFAIAAYNSYIPVADKFARKITESVVKDEYSHLNFGEIWLARFFEQVKEEVEAANRQVMPVIWRMLNWVESDMKALGMVKATLIEDFISRYGEALGHIGFTTRDILRMSVYGLRA